MFDYDIVNPDGVSYVDIKNLIKVFSSTEYDSLEKAASEIIDNAIDANAKNIFIFLRSSFDVTKGKNVLSDIAFLDDGEGMTPGLLQHVVGFGSSSRNGGGKIGKFGIGMNQASLFACKKFEVYSWTEENEVYKEVFDSEYIVKNNIDKAYPPEKTKLPSYILNSGYFERSFKNHGTLIVWSKFRENKIAKPITIAKRMKNEFGRVYRNYLYNGSLKIHTCADSKLDMIYAIDPMFLLENTEVLGDKNGHSYKSNEGEPLFELFSNELLENGCKAYDVPYFDEKDNTKKYSKVYLRAAVIKEKFYYEAAFKDNIKQPGDTEIGSYVKEFQKGITVLRNNREIDFNYFGFYDSTNQPQDRWFKLEISFNEELDSAFHVSNNKQHVELKKIADSKIPDVKEDDPNYPMWLRLNKDITKLLGAMRNRNRTLAQNAKNKLRNEESTDSLSDNNYQSLEDMIDSINGKVSISDSKDENKYEEKNKICLNVSTKEEVKKIGYEKFYDDNSIVVSYEEGINGFVNYQYDFNLKKYIITFNKDKINDDKFNNNIEYLIVILCVEICDEGENSYNGKELIKLLNKYSLFLSRED